VTDNHTAFLKLLEPARASLYRYALAVTTDPEDAKDLMSDTILLAYEQFHKLRDSSKFLHLLLVIASRLTRRRRWRSKRMTAVSAEMLEQLSITCESIERKADLALALDALKLLPQKQRETVILFDVLDLSLEDIRKLQGGTLSGVKARLSRGRAALALHLGVRQDLASVNETDTITPEFSMRHAR
jgi:RNA polymerase sigma-70 factor, ECF subfamily